MYFVPLAQAGARCTWIGWSGLTGNLSRVLRFVFQYFGWRVAAMTTPTLMLATGSGFFAFSLASKYFSIADPITVATFAATMGALTQIVARSSKFALFDPAKEMVYIEMDGAERKKGKAAVDLVGSQFGKTGASWITQVSSNPPKQPVKQRATGGLTASFLELLSRVLCC